jgi:hypothetical protein
MNNKSSPAGALSWLGVLAVLSCGLGTAHAQTSFTMTVLGKPSGSNVHVPAAMDSSGTVHGGAYFSTGLKFGNGKPCWICPQYVQKQVTWPASTAASVAATVGVPGFFSVGANDKGTLVGGYEPSYRWLGQPALYSFTTSIPFTAYTRLMYKVVLTNPGLLQAGKAINLTPPPGTDLTQPYPYDYEVTALSDQDVLLVNRTSTVNDAVALPYTYANGQYTPLGTSTMRARESLFADVINKQGVIYGHVAMVMNSVGTYDDRSVYPVVWTPDGRSQRLDSPDGPGAARPSPSARSPMWPF